MPQTIEKCMVIHTPILALTYITALLMAICTPFSPAAAQDDSVVDRIETKLPVIMRDGVNLPTDVYFPNSSDERIPTVLIRTPYELGPLVLRWRRAYADKLLEAGYAIAFQNERGRFWSGGEYTFLVGAGEDGYDTVDWVAKQPWSNGKVATIGCSSSAENQMRLAGLDHPAHAAAVLMAPGAGIGKMSPYQEQGTFYRGGAWQPAWLDWYYNHGQTARPPRLETLSRDDMARMSHIYRLNADRPKPDVEKAVFGLPISKLMESINGAPSDLDRFILREPGALEWSELEFFNEGDSFAVPGLWIFSWYDISISPNIAAFNYVRENAATAHDRDHQHMVISPMDHCRMRHETENTIIGERNVGDARFDYLDTIIGFLDRHMKPQGRQSKRQTPTISAFMMGGEWETYDVWPPKSMTPTPFYLSSNEGANGLYGDGTLNRTPPEQPGADIFVYDPSLPVPSVGGSICCFGEAKAGAFDQREVELRADVLVYTSAPFTETVRMAGPFEAILYLSSDRPDTDVTVKILDVYPDGRAYNIAESIQRLRYRNGYHTPEMMEPGEVYKVIVRHLDIANAFKPGHRLRLEVSSSNFPRFARNLNTGGPAHAETEPQVAQNKIHFSGAHQSRLVAPVLK